uniref:Uncharacterized protein n=1 Tax=Glossina pallidipes TaxID=7398 RepID=A0A1A9ZGE5_GLOPL
MGLNFSLQVPCGNQTADKQMDLPQRFSGGTKCSGSTFGNSQPSSLTLIKCIAKANSSESRKPSPSTSESFQILLSTEFDYLTIDRHLLLAAIEVDLITIDWHCIQRFCRTDTAHVAPRTARSSICFVLYAGSSLDS